jgi:hypothetical protein
MMLLAATGCSSGPKSDTVGTSFRTAWIAKHTTKMATPYENVKTEQDRNEFIDEYVAIKNIQFHNLVKSLRRGASFGNLTADGSRLILDGLAATSGGATAKAGLAAASAGITGFTGTVKKDLLFDQALPSFFTKMEELRANKLADITRKKSLSIKEYTRTEAFNDVEEYGTNGTFDAALRALNVQTGQSAALASSSLSHEKGDDVSAAAADRGSGIETPVPAVVAPRKTQQITQAEHDAKVEAAIKRAKESAERLTFNKALGIIDEVTDSSKQKVAYTAIANIAGPQAKPNFASLNKIFVDSPPELRAKMQTAVDEQVKLLVK